MANRRMFSLDVVDSDLFLDMPVSAQCLYYHLGMRADDDGFVSSPKKIIGFTGCKIDDLKVLILKGFVISFESGIVVIRHWRQNNYVRCDRYTSSVHTEEMKILKLENGVYNVSMTYGIPSDIPAVYPDKNRIDKNRIDKDSINTICPELDKSTLSGSGILLPLVDKTFYDVPADKIKAWEEAYPAVNVTQELKKMIVWLDSNPTKKKTRRGISRFINGWLERSQNHGGGYYNQQPVQPAEKSNLPYDDVLDMTQYGKGLVEPFPENDDPWILPDADLYD